MSLRANLVLRTWLDVRARLWRTPFTYRRQLMTQRDHDTYCDALLLQLSLVCDILGHDTPSQLRCFDSYLKFLIGIDAYELSLGIKHFGSVLRSYSPVLDQFTYTDFKRQCSLDFPWAGEFLAPVKPLLERYLEIEDVSCFRRTLHYLSFLTRLSLVDIDLGSNDEAAYMQRESDMEGFQFDDEMINDLCQIITEWFKDYPKTGVGAPHHGPGGVATFGRITVDQKYNVISSDTRLDYHVNRYYGGWTGLTPYPPKTSLSRISDVVFVPKTALSRRTISMEPCPLMFFQQGVREDLYDYMNRHRYLRQHCPIRDDQSINRELARLGSSNRQFVTIDLSAASDSVSWELVKRVFRKTNLYRALICTRSDCTRLPNGSVVRLNKFAPMGSALCFPIETIIFSAICERATRRVGSTRSSRYLVFGDDIIIEYPYFQEVMSSLRSLGFSANMGKTFWHPLHPFREACGGEYYDGNDVTPFRLPRKFKGLHVSQQEPSQFSLLVDLVNRAYQHGMLHTRNILLRGLLDLEQPYRPKFGHEGGCILSDTDSNYHLKGGYSLALHRQTLRRGVVVSSHTGKCDERIRYHEWLRSTYHREVVQDPTIVWTGKTRTFITSKRA